jgi:hypothetical protein
MITLILTVLCTGPAPYLHTQYAETTPAWYEQDVQLLRMGWVDGDRRCKAVRVRYSKT